MKNFLVLTCLILLFSSALMAQNTLATLANSMQPGTFALLNSEGDGSNWGNSILWTGGSNGITGFAGKMVYDAATDRVYFSGGEHSGATKTIHYDIATNRWVDDGGVPSPPFQWGHAYDSNAIIPSARELWANSRMELTFGSNQNLRRLDLTTNTWSAPPLPQAFYQTEPSMEYFPDRDELLWLQGGWLGGLAAYKKSTNTWTTVHSGGGSYDPNATTNLGALQIRGALARYIPSLKAVLLFGGINTDPQYPAPDVASHAVYKYDANGVLTRLSDMPASIWVYINHAVAVVDPVTSDLIVINARLSGNWVNESGNPNPFTGINEMWKWSPATDTWTALNINILPNPAQWWEPSDTSNNSGSWPFGVTTTTIPRYGVSLVASPAILFWPGRQSRVYVYKHSASSPPPPPPPTDTTQPTVTMTSPIGGVTVSGVISVSADASDNVAVAGVQFKLDGANLGAEDTTAPFAAQWDTLLSSNTVHSLTATARDAAGNQATSAAVLVTVDNTVPPPPPPPPPSNTTFDQKCGQSGVIACYGFDSPANLRSTPGITAAYPFKYNWDSQGTPCQSLGISYPLTRDRGPGDMNARAFNVNGTCYYPVVDTVITGATGGGALRMDVPSGADQNNSGFFDTTYRGIDQSHVAVQDLWFQFRYRSSDMALNTFGNSTSFQNTFTKTFINCAVPPGNDYCGSDPSLSMVFIFASNGSGSGGWSPTRNGMWQSYTYNAQGNVAPTERTIGPELYLQNAAECPYTFSGTYNYPPCVRLIDNEWTEITHHLKINPGTGTGVIQEYINGVPIIDLTDQAMALNGTAGWGEIRLQPHQTGKTSGLNYTSGAVWYDDLVISTQPIAMGSVTPPPPPPPPTNTAPIVNAGTDQTITLPVNSVNLTGTAFDDGLPSGVLTYQWSGPSGVTFSNAAALATMVTFGSAGSFSLTLTVTDGALTASDGVNVTVNSLPPQNPCVASPLVVTVTSWPNVAAGSRQFRYTASHALSSPGGFTLNNNLTRAVFTDLRGCMTVVTK